MHQYCTNTVHIVEAQTRFVENQQRFQIVGYRLPSATNANTDFSLQGRRISAEVLEGVATTRPLAA